MTQIAESPNDTSQPVEPRISYVIARLERAVRSGINERVRPYGLTTLQYTTLSLLGARGQPLSNARLIRRDPHPNHRRVYPATLTPKGRRVLAACDAAVGTMEEDMLAELGPSERTTLLTSLKACVRSLSAGFP